MYSWGHASLVFSGLCLVSPCFVKLNVLRCYFPGAISYDEAEARRFRQEDKEAHPIHTTSLVRVSAILGWTSLCLPSLWYRCYSPLSHLILQCASAEERFQFSMLDWRIAADGLGVFFRAWILLLRLFAYLLTWDFTYTYFSLDSQSMLPFELFELTESLVFGSLPHWSFPAWSFTNPVCFEHFLLPGITKCSNFIWFAHPTPASIRLFKKPALIQFNSSFSSTGARTQGLVCARQLPNTELYTLA